MKHQQILISILIVLSLGLSACHREPQLDDSFETPNNTTSEAYLTRDVRDDIFYFVMPDRFNNGDPENDQGSTEHAISRGGLDKSSKWAFHGGDIRGLEQKLDYLKEMGITAIWMTPILRNKAVQDGGFGHHGYWTVDFTSLDPHFGSNQDLKSLIDTAHSKDIKVFFDIITNHTADVIKYRECHSADGKTTTESGQCAYKTLAQNADGDNYTPFVPLLEQGSKVPSWLNDPKYYHNQGDTTFEGENSLYGDFNGLDDLNTEHPKVVSGMIEIYQNIIRDFRPDGFRIDTVRHVQLPFWQKFGPAIERYAQEQGIPNFHIFGEVYDPDPVQLSVFTTAGKLPSVLDFGFQKAASDVFYKGENPMLIKELFEQDHLYQDEDSQADLLMTFLGNHDMGRPGLFINQAQPQSSADEKLKRSIVSHAFMYLSRGIPVIYYGDEQGFSGDGNDVDAREDMFPSSVASYNDNTLLGSTASVADDNFDNTHPIYSALKEFAILRKSHRALRYGVYEHLHTVADSMVFAFSRKIEANSEELLIVFNAGTQPSEVTFDVADKSHEMIVGDAKYSQLNQTITMVLPGLSFSVFKPSQ